MDKKDPTTSLRDFIQGILKTDFQPGLKSMIPQRAQGTVVIEKKTLLDWLSSKWEWANRQNEVTADAGSALQPWQDASKTSSRDIHQNISRLLNSPARQC